MARAAQLTTRTASSAPCFMNSSLKIIAKLTNNETTNMLIIQANISGLMKR